MRVVIQRVSSAAVEVEGNTVASINTGMLVLLGIEHDDNTGDIEWLVKKVVNLRIFPDENGVMNLSLADTIGEVIIVSQFTLHASTKKGNRPSYIKAARPEVSLPLYNEFVEQFKSEYKGKVETGSFGARMKVSLVNDGPVTIIIDSRNKE